MLSPIRKEFLLSDVTTHSSTAIAQTVANSPFSETPTVLEIVEFQATGLLVVFSVLGAIVAVCKVISFVLSKIAPNSYYVRKR